MKNSKTGFPGQKVNPLRVGYALKTAFRDMRQHKGRTCLAILSLVLGIAFLTASVGIAQGRAASKAAAESSFLPNTFHVRLLDKDQSRMPTYDDMKLLQAENSGLMEYLVPNQTKQVKLKFGTKIADTTLVGTTPDYLKISRAAVRNGKFITRFDTDNRRRVMVLGSFAAKSLFGEDNPVGKEIKIDNQIYSVVGVLNQMADSEFSSTSGSVDDIALIPYTTGRTLFDSSQVDRYAVGAKRAGAMAEAKELVNDYLLERYGRPTLYSIEPDRGSPGQSSVPVGLLVLIAVLTFLIGGVMVLGGLLVSLAERREELMIRQISGASRLDLLVQFWAEGALVGLTGGIAGVILGCAAAVLCGAFLHFNAFPNILWLIAALAGSVLAGGLFSLPAAKKAAQE